MRAIWISLFALSVLVSCEKPPPHAYKGAGGVQTATIPMGMDSAGNQCAGNRRDNGDVVFYCGADERPTGRVVTERTAGDAVPADLAVASQWRSGIDSQFLCGAPKPAQTGDGPGAELTCKRRIGGFLRFALVVAKGGTAYFGDSDPDAAPVLQRAFGLATGRLSADAVAAATTDSHLTPDNVYAGPMSSSDIGYYDKLMYDAARANLESNYALAEQDYGFAVELLYRKQGKQTPSAADPLLHQAMQLSNLGLFKDAHDAFETAAKLLGAGDTEADQLDATLPATLDLYLGLDALNQNKPDSGLSYLDKAEAGFRKFLRDETKSAPRPAGVSTLRGPMAAISNLSDAEFYRQLEPGRAAMGVVSVMRSRAVALKMQGKLNESLAASEAAEKELANHSLALAQLQARVLRTSAAIYEAKGAARPGHPESDRDSAKALELIAESDAAFIKAFANSRPAAETDLLLAAQLLRAGSQKKALTACERATGALKELIKTTRESRETVGVPVSLIMPCIDAWYASGDLSAMFEAAQLAQTTLASTQIARAGAKLASGNDVREAYDREDEAKRRLNELTRLRRALELRGAGGADVSRELAELDPRIDRARREGRSARTVVASNEAVRHLTQSVATVPDLGSMLGSHETFALIVLGDDHGWTFVLHDGRIAAARIDGGLKPVETMVQAIRDTMRLDNGKPVPFASDDARKLYTALFGQLSGVMDDTRRLVVAPSGPLLSLPFGLLLTGPVGGDLAKAPWLIQSMTVEHVPAAVNFVLFHDKVKKSTAASAWAGFGAPLPITLPMANTLFNTEPCRPSAAKLANLPELQGTVAELDDVMALLHGSSADRYTGAKFTFDTVRNARLDTFKIVDFATHGLLPSDLACQDEPAIIMSPQGGNASAALLTSSQIATLKLNADAVLLSACNSGGPEGELGGESLSGLARSFFSAGARSLIVTHWDVNDRVLPHLVHGMFERYEQKPDAGLAKALAETERQMLSEATGELAVFAHPQFWAPLALIGDGGARIN
jgi:CHAT domain-containing protein